MHPAYCPQCGERVTPYAAGCAICGAELDPRRWQRQLSFSERFSGRLPARLRRLRVRRAAKAQQQSSR
jgi:hypothetical protein